MAPVNRQWVFAGRLQGPLSDKHFELRETTPPKLRQGQALVRVRLVSIDPANRLYFSMQNYRPQIFAGDVMGGFGIGEVVESTDPRFRKGDLWHGDFGWQDYATVNSYDRQEYWYRCSNGHSESDLLGVLGITGMTAWFGVREVLKPIKGETAVVAGATGACGSIIAQLLKIRGCRVVGIGGGTEKCRWLTKELGLDAAVDYQSVSLHEELRAACPQGVHLFSDAVGGELSRAVLPLMSRGARWFHFGNLSAYDEVRPGSPVPRHDAFLTAELRAHCQAEALKPTFLLAFDHYCNRHEAEAHLARLLKDGVLKAPIMEIRGFELLPRVLVSGKGEKKKGKLIVRIAES